MTAVFGLGTTYLSHEISSKRAQRQSYNVIAKREPFENMMKSFEALFKLFFPYGFQQVKNRNI